MPLDTKSEPSCYISPNTAAPHKNVRSLYSAFYDAPNLVAPKEISFSLSVFDIKFEVLPLKIGFQNLRLIHSIKYLHDLHDFKDLLN